MTNRLLGLIALALSLSSCGGFRIPASMTTQALQSSWEINFTDPVAGCSTGVIQFTDKSAYCNSLLDPAVGNGCAMPERRGKHVVDCAVPN